MTLTIRLFTMLFLALSFTNLYSQKNIKILIPEIPYDSTVIFLGDKAAQYTGQTLCLKKLPQSQREIGYPNFILNYKKIDQVDNLKNIYKCNDGYNSEYYELANQHFFVEQAFQYKQENWITGEEDEYTFLKLKEVRSGDIIYYNYTGQSVYSFPFVVLGYVEKQKQMLSNKEFIFTDAILLNAVDETTLQPIEFASGEKWKYDDIFIDNYHFELSLIAQNSKGIKIAVPLTEVWNKTLPRKVYTLNEAEEIRSKFGINNYSRILQQKIASNMNKEALKLSWGEPLEIQRKGSNEEWIYTAGSIIFNSGKIVQIK